MNVHASANCGPFVSRRRIESFDEMTESALQLRLLPTPGVRNVLLQEAILVPNKDERCRRCHALT